MKIEVKSDENIRLDNFLIKHIDKSRSKIQSLIKKNNILVNNNSVKSSYIVKLNDVIDICDDSEQILDIKPEKMDLSIVYEDDSVIVLNKDNFNDLQI